MRATQFILKTNTIISATMTSFLSIVNLILLSRTVAKHIVGSVLSYTLNVNSI